MTTRTYFAIGFASVALVAALTDIASAGMVDDIKLRGKLICGTEGVNPRFSLQNPVTRKLEGSEPELCAKVAEAIGVPIEYKLVTSASRIPELMQGQVDLLAAGISWTAERAKQIDYSNTYFSQPFSVMVPVSTGIADFKQLETARFANVKGSLLESVTRKRFPNAPIISFDEASQQFLALDQGKADAMVSGLYYLRTYQMKSGEDKYRILDEELSRVNVGFAVRKGDKEWVEYLNKVLEDLETSGEGQAIYEKNFGDMGLPRSYKFGSPIN
ncbi:polar amino acid transport system substrate-binding protein [Aminobacter lissarensis]|uniref:Polar amino acid transport system substrate-binding protein n=1 Tax=Aminobacter carboxidus TaxID=376165 RepID=A0A8E1WKN4_9HYPH|nr:transporter substrate-binding domain-containing protein [Aminobacter lissarensis]MBB6469115.1 polar amino acid transport system substrate-binding protein [Aminobacter lissarensis]